MSYISFPDTELEAAIQIQETSELPLTIPKPTKPNPVKISDHSNQTEPQSITNSPTSIEFVTEHTAHPVCRYKQYTYVGNRGGVDRISDDGQVQEGFINGLGFGVCCVSIIVHYDMLYILTDTGEHCYKIQIHNLLGNLIGSLETHCRIGNRLIIPDLLVVYSLTGDIIKHAPCVLFTGSELAMTQVGGDNSVIVSVNKISSVLRMNIDSGEVMWASNHVRNPQGVVCYRNRYVLVTNYGSETRIWILDINTGEWGYFAIWIFDSSGKKERI
mgnify:FL=1